MWKRHNPFFLAAIVGLVALALALCFAPADAYVVAANVFFVIYLGSFHHQGPEIDAGIPAQAMPPNRMSQSGSFSP